jgi:hypothetical protein
MKLTRTCRDGVKVVDWVRREMASLLPSWPLSLRKERVWGVPKVRLPFSPLSRLELTRWWIGSVVGTYEDSSKGYAEQVKDKARKRLEEAK